MLLPVSLPGFELRTIQVQLAGPLSAPKLLIDGEPAPRGPKRGQYLLRRNDGTEAIAQLRSRNVLDPIPQLVVEGQTYPLAEPLKWYQWLWGGLPFALVLVGGLLGGLFGGLALFINGRLFRSQWPGIAKYAASAGVSLAAVAGFFVTAAIFQLSVADLLARPEVFRSEAGRFTVAAPVKLTEAVQTVDVPPLGQLDLHTFTGQRGNMFYYVSYTDYPAEVVQQSDPLKMLEGSRDGASRSVNGTLVADVPITLAGHPGREFTIQGPAENGQALTIAARIFLVDNRLYQLMLVNPSGAQPGDFFASFAVLEE